MLINKNKLWGTGYQFFFDFRKRLQRYFKINTGKNKNIQTGAIPPFYNIMASVGQPHKINTQINLNVCFGNEQCLQPFIGHSFNISEKQSGYSDVSYLFATKESLVNNIGNSSNEESFNFQLIQGGQILQIKKNESDHFNIHAFKKLGSQAEIKMI